VTDVKFVSATFTQDPFSTTAGAGRAVRAAARGRGRLLPRRPGRRSLPPLAARRLALGGRWDRRKGVLARRLGLRSEPKRSFPPTLLAVAASGDRLHSPVERLGRADRISKPLVRSFPYLGRHHPSSFFLLTVTSGKRAADCRRFEPLGALARCIPPLDMPRWEDPRRRN
jgi:hypothetical protein